MANDENKTNKSEAGMDPTRRRFLKNTGLVVGGVAGGSLLGGLFVNQSDGEDDSKKDKAATPRTRGREFFARYEDFVVLAGFVFTNNKLLLKSEIGEPYDPETGVIGRNFTGHFSNISTYIGARGFFDDKKFNLAMGAGSLGATLDDFSGDNIDHTDLDFLHGYEI